MQNYVLKMKWRKMLVHHLIHSKHSINVLSDSTTTTTITTTTTLLLLNRLSNSYMFSILRQKKDWGPESWSNSLRRILRFRGRSDLSKVTQDIRCRSHSSVPDGGSCALKTTLNPWILTAKRIARCRRKCTGIAVQDTFNNASHPLSGIPTIL
jgi:hypothetical protein